MKDMKRTKAELVAELRTLRERLAAAEDEAARADADEPPAPPAGPRTADLAARLDRVERLARLGSWEWDLGGGGRTWSAGAFRVFGLEPAAEAPGLEAVLELVHPDDRRRYRAAVNRALSDPDTGVSLVHRIVTPAGAVRHVHTRGEAERVAGGAPRRLVGTCQDVTDQALADAALQESERRFSLFMDHLPAAVMIKSGDGKLLYANRYLRGTFGAVRTPSRGPRHARGLVDRQPGDDRRALREGLHVREERIPDLEGRPRWLRTVKFAIPREDDAPLLGGIAWDATERHEAVAALHESEQRYRSLWDNAPVALWLEDCSEVVAHLERLRARGVTDLDAHFDAHPEDLRRCAGMIRVVSVNQAAVDMNGVAGPDDLVGTLDRLLDDAALPSLRPVLKAVAEGRTTMEFENEVVTPDGETRTIAMRFFTPPEYSRTWQTTLVAATDFTERRRLWRSLSLRTRELTALSELAADAAGAETPDGILDAAVRCLRETIDPDLAVLELAADGEAGRRVVLDGETAAGPAPEAAALEALLARAVADGVPVHARDPEGPFAARAAFPLRHGGETLGAFGLALRDGAGLEAREPFLSAFAAEIAGAAVARRLGRSIRELGARLEDQVAAGAAGLEAAVRRARDDGAFDGALLDRVSHELRTPLTSIIGFTGVILQGMAGSLNEEQRRQLGMADRSAAHLLALVDDVIDLTRLQTGRLEVASAPLRLDELAAAAVAAAAPAAEARGLDLRLETPPDLPSARGDARRVRRILDELLDNALKHTAAGSITVSCAASGGRVVARVADTGHGVPAADRERIFTPFQGAGSDAGTRGEGTGLGLYLGRAIADLMGGRLDLAAIDGPGSVFVLDLPAEEGS